MHCDGDKYQENSCQRERKFTALIASLQPPKLSVLQLIALCSKTTPHE